MLTLCVNLCPKMRILTTKRKELRQYNLIASSVKITAKDELDAKMSGSGKVIAY